MKRTAYHLTEVLRLLAKAERDRSTINLKAWTSDGETVDYTGWLVRGSSWRGGFHRLVNPTNAEVRTVPDIYIHQFLGLPVYL